MSKWLDHAELIASRIRESVSYCLASVPEADRIEVIVDRKGEIVNLVNQAAARARGGSVVIRWTGAKNPDTESNLLRTGSEYAITCMVSAITKGDVLTCDDLTEEVAEAVHSFAPDPSPRPRKLRVTDINYVPRKNIVIYEISAEILRL